MQPTPPQIEFGALPRRTTCGDGTFPVFRELYEPIPRKLWQPVSMRRHVTTIYSQLSTMCTANGACGVMMVDRKFRGRIHNPVLSPENLFGQIASPGEGTSLDDILYRLVEFGVCTREEIPPENWHPKSWPADWRTTAAQNCVLEWIDLDADFDAVASCLQRYQPCLVGVYWPGRRRAGHAVCVTELWTDGAQWGIGGPNSWGEDWGDDGFYRLTERECADFGTFGCWALGSTTA